MTHEHVGQGGVWKFAKSSSCDSVLLSLKGGGVDKVNVISPRLRRGYVTKDILQICIAFDRFDSSLHV